MNSSVLGGAIFGGAARQDVFYDCVLALRMPQSSDRVASAVLIAPNLALSIRHAFRAELQQLYACTAISRKRATVKRIVFQDGSDFVFGQGKPYPEVPPFRECDDPIVILELDTPLDVSPASPFILQESFAGTLCVASEENAVSNAGHVRTATVSPTSSACAGMLTVRPALPAGGFPMESGAPAFVLTSDGCLKVIGIQSGGNDDAQTGPNAPRGPGPHAIATIAKVSTDLLTLIGKLKKRALPDAAESSRNVVTTLDRISGAVPAVLSGAATANSSPGTFRLMRADNNLHEDDCLMEVPDVSVFDGVDWAFIASGPDGIFTTGDQVSIISLSATTVRLQIKTAPGSGQKTKVDETLVIGGIGGGRHWLVSERDVPFEVGGIMKAFAIYLFRRTDDDDNPAIPRRFRVEAYNLTDGGNISDLPDKCSVVQGCTWPTSAQRFSRVLLAQTVLAPVGPYQDDIGNGHEH